MLTNPKETTDNRLEILGNRCRKVGCLHPKETTAGKIVSLALLDWPLHKVSSRDGKVVLEKCKDILKRFRKSFDNKKLPPLGTLWIHLNYLSTGTGKVMMMGSQLFAPSC